MSLDETHGSVGTLAPPPGAEPAVASATAGSRQLELEADGLDVLFGTQDEHLQRLEKTFGVRVTARGGRLTISGEDAGVDTVGRLLEDLSALVVGGYRLRAVDIQTAIRILEEDPGISLRSFFEPQGIEAAVRRHVTPRTLRQQLYLRAMAEYDIVVSVGPAGTGKTYLAVAMAAACLLEKKVRRIVLARPAVEAGEKLGFLPGDLVEKVNPYLRPLYDSLYDIIGFEKVGKLIERGVIEVAPIAFMRGRSLNESFIILDEAQNTTSEQMKMFLTRIGFGSKAVINGDATQIDLPQGRASGLQEAVKVLDGVGGIAFSHFDRRDVVRHPLVQKVVDAYERYELTKAEREPDHRRYG